MHNLVLGASLLAVAFATSGCATHATAKFDAADSLASPSSFKARYSAEQSGENSYSWGDKYTAANLFLQADKADNSIKNRFNLATAYAAIGKIYEAREMYSSLVTDGQFTRLSTDSAQIYAIPARSFNVSHEAQARLQALDALPLGPTGAIGESGKSETGHTDEEARVLDQNAEDGRGRALEAVSAKTRLSALQP